MFSTEKRIRLPFPELCLLRYGSSCAVTVRFSEKSVFVSNVKQCLFRHLLSCLTAHCATNSSIFRHAGFKAPSASLVKLARIGSQFYPHFSASFANPFLRFVRVRKLGISAWLRSSWSGICEIKSKFLVTPDPVLLSNIKLVFRALFNLCNLQLIQQSSFEQRLKPRMLMIFSKQRIGRMKAEETVDMRRQSESWLCTGLSNISRLSTERTDENID